MKCPNCGHKLNRKEMARDLAAKGGAAKFRNMTEEQRKAHILKMVEARQLQREVRRQVNEIHASIDEEMKESRRKKTV